jgi:cadmium resistance protein CadD (predicted permease)
MSFLFSFLFFYFIFQLLYKKITTLVGVVPLTVGQRKCDVKLKKKKDAICNDTKRKFEEILHQMGGSNPVVHNRIFMIYYNN